MGGSVPRVFKARSCSCPRCFTHQQQYTLHQEQRLAHHAAGRVGGRVTCDRVPTCNVSTTATASEASSHAGRKSEGRSVQLPEAEGTRQSEQGGPRGAGAVWVPDLLLHPWPSRGRLPGQNTNDSTKPTAFGTDCYEATSVTKKVRTQTPVQI